MTHEYKVGDLVWLKEDPILGCKREQAKILDIPTTGAVLYEQTTNANGDEFGIFEGVLADIEDLV